MTLNLSDVEENPALLSFRIRLENSGDFVLRPLEPNDSEILADFLGGLSAQTREFYTLDGYDFATAKEFCDGINRFDKLRFVLVKESSGECVGLFEYSLDIPEGDKERFLGYGITLETESDCGFGPCLSELFQNRGLGSALFPILGGIARRLGRRRIILWGGVYACNKRAIKFYENNGFEKLGSFIDQDKKETLDMIIELGNRRNRGAARSRQVLPETLVNQTRTQKKTHGQTETVRKKLVSRHARRA